jgi:N-formylmaleamate deformylase
MTHWMSGVCDASGVNIHYLRTGGSKSPVVLLHGLTGGGACWTLLARALEADYDVVMPDARGHGNSSTSPTGYRYDNYASDVIRLVQGLELVAPVLLGHSMGGLTAAVVASQVGTAVRGVVLADPTFLSPQRQRDVHESDVIEQHHRLLGLERAEVLAQARVRHAHRNPELVELIAEARMKARIAAFDVLTPPNPDYRRLVSLIQVPILLIISDGGVVSLETASELQSLNPRLRVEQIQNAGHGLHYDQPERFAAVVRHFLVSVAGKSVAQSDCTDSFRRSR